VLKGFGGMSTIASIAGYVQGIDFPKSKSDIVEYVREKNAPDKVIDVLEKLPDRYYESMSDLMKGVGQVE
jgi:hypothetical protein